MKKKIVLGSASPRRRELLSQIGVESTVRISEKEEVYHSTVPEEIVKELALMKAENVAEDLAAKLRDPAGGRLAAQPGISGAEALKDIVIIGADTVVVLDRTILGKPEDEEDAFRMLRALQGRAHEVYTGVAVLVHDSGGRRHTKNHAVKTEVYVHAMTEEEIRSYIASGEPMDKAGAYAGDRGKYSAGAGAGRYRKYLCQKDESHGKLCDRCAPDAPGEAGLCGRTVYDGCAEPAAAQSGCGGA